MNTANKLTMTRVVMIPIFLAVLYLVIPPYNHYIALAIFILASVTDFIDGYVARHYNQITDFGKFMDPLADKVLVMDQRRIAMYDTVEKVFARADELLELGLSVPQVTKVFLRLRAMGLDLPQDVYTVPYAVKTIQAALAKKNGGGEATC